eukprot:TRINITY_DN17604_c0_g1_i1.p1 TRINITY_DN17604_c0_g1~~TRINITY_DN17604_c0_g1_i1.p1  ORF type:complete len:194 (-),score=37.61 TRINITY_DN17604_c0_g1_i1:130-711(-)
MIRRPPRSTQGVSSAASDVYKRQVSTQSTWEVSYLDPANVFKGIKIHYTHGMSFTTIEIYCDQAYTKPAFIRAERVHVGYIFRFKSDHVCRNFAVPLTDRWSKSAIFLVFLLFVIAIYFGLGLYLSLQQGTYNDCSDLLPNKEILYNCCRKIKDCFNNTVGSHSAEIEESKTCLLYTSPSPRDLSTSRMPSSA